MEDNYPGCGSFVKEAFRLKDVSEEAADVMLLSLTNSTRKQYDCGLKKWWGFCQRENINPYQGSIPEILVFLTEEYSKGMSYGSLNSFRSAISLIYGKELGEDHRVKRFLKGVSKLRPQKPKYDTTWYPRIVLDHVRQWGHNADLTLEKLSMKLAILLALVTGHRIQTLTAIDIRNIQKIHGGISVKIPEQIKTSGINRPQPTLIIPFFPEDDLVCPALVLQIYLDKTQSMRSKEQKLFLSYRKPHGPVSTQTFNYFLFSLFFFRLYLIVWN